MEFLRVEADSEERIKNAQTGFKFHETKNELRANYQEKATAATLTVTQKQQVTCVFCKNQGHNAQDCLIGQKMTLEERQKLVKENKRCFACLVGNHFAKFCKHAVRCIVCKRRHYAIMCDQIKSNDLEISKKDDSQTNMFNQNRTDILLQTIIVYLKHKDKHVKVRAMYDTGSQKSYILTNVARELGLEKINEDHVVHQLFGGVTREVKHCIYEVSVQSLDRKFEMKVNVLDQETICNAVPKISDKELIIELNKRKIALSDNGNSNDTEIKFLIGADLIAKLFTNQVYKTQTGALAMNTKFGWTVIGQSSVHKNTINSVRLSYVQNISDLWELEVLGITDPYEVKKKEELQADVMNQFNKGIKVNEDGRYEVKLPWSLGHEILEENKKNAFALLESLTKRLEKNKLYKEYDEILRDWESSGIIERVDNNKKEECHYLPHHVVIKANSTSTRLRPVFNASSKDSQGNSLNFCLEKGPNLIELIPNILNKFRLKKIGVKADIKKAFLQISLSPEDRKFLKFLWWDDKKNVIAYQHCRVVFGVSSSPFLLGATIQYHLNKMIGVKTTLVEKLKKSFYVDDCLTSVENEEELEHFISQASEIMNKGKFELTKWDFTGNDKSVEPKTYVLGLLWDIKEDTLSCSVELAKKMTGKATKRKLLAAAAQSIFDTVGFSAPITILPKLLLQDLWKQNINWDEELPHEISKKFEEWINQCEMLSSITIPRCLIKSCKEIINYTYHVFSDASKLAFGAAVFLRTESSEGVELQLVQAKNRIAPIREITIPRLELMAAVVGVRLWNSVNLLLQLETECSKQISTVFWCDSTVVLAWIKRKENWNIFVKNRIEEILEISNREQWRHVPGTKNPADLLSRGCNVSQLQSSQWWNGPEWLKSSEEFWPKEEVKESTEDIEKEKRKTVCTHLNTKTEYFTDNFRYFSSYIKNVRVIAWIRRFIYNLKNKTQKIKTELRGEEFKEAELILLKLVQKEKFEEDNSSLKNLEIYQDNNEIYRLKTRLVFSENACDFKTPIVLPDGHITSQLIMNIHKQLLHSGVNAVMCELRDRFWLIKCRKTVGKVIADCLVCKRAKVKTMQVPIAPLPSDRVNQSSTFEVTGVDLAGPLIIKDHNKAWIVIFTCAVYRCVHLELVLSLSTDTFVLALRRFIARRGRPTTIYSDNGTNFIRLNNQLKELDWSSIQSFCCTKQITWKLNPPTAAWWGGWWERLIRIIKDLLKKTLGKAFLKHEELYTLVIDCEAVLNNRPMTYMSEEYEELVALTPAMFIQSNQNVRTPDLDKLDGDNLRKRVKYLQSLRESLHKRFVSEYLGNLKNYSRIYTDNITVGTVVLITSENAKRINWPLGKVIETFEGKDKVVRVVKVKTAKGELVRPVQKLCVLEMNREPPALTGHSHQDQSPAVSKSSAKMVRRNKNSEEKPMKEPVKEKDVQLTRKGRPVKKPGRFC